MSGDVTILPSRNRVAQYFQPRGMCRRQVRFGDTIVIQGAGPVGPEVRLAAAKRFGVDVVIDIARSTEEERLNAVRDLTRGRGADITIEATRVPSAVPEGMRLTRDAGRYIVVGQYTNVGDTSFNPHLDLNQKHLEIRGCWGSDVGHLYRSVHVMAKYAKQFRWTDLISGEYDLLHAQDALDDVEAQRVVKALIVP